jgi:ABC-type multidrug transport system ATPase subunit/ABC-type multidrug transport system permease subunit
MLCGENGSVDITDFLDEEIRGPGRFECDQLGGGANECKFREPAMDNLIMDLLGDESIQLTCRSGECLWHTDVPGYERPVKRINTPLIAGVIAGCSLFLVAAILATWYLSRRSMYGPIALGDDTDTDDEQLKLMTDHKPAALYFDQVSYSLGGHQILSGIGGAALPGEVTAIMGASGAGKTTFLDILARKNKRGTVAGDFFVNGERVADADFKAAVGFVDQEDTMLPTLTVHETILNSALLRLPRDMSRAAKEQRVVEVERELGIHHIRNSLIGSEEGKGRGISGGEKRRVGIACELVTSPSILFLDEPTSGLDAYNAYNVVESLVTLAKTYRRTVVFTIHQPRSNIVALFDRLILLAQGRTVYSGPFTRCQAYFSEIGYACPRGYNIADYLVDLTMHAGTRPFNDDDYDADAVSVAAPSSLVAVKSVASVDEAASSTRSSHRRNGSSSIRHSQDRDLFTRRRPTSTSTSTAQQPPPPPDTAASSDAGDEPIGTYRMQRNPPSSAAVPLLGGDDADVDDAPPPAAVAATELDELVHAFAASAIARSTHAEMRQAVDAAAQANGQNAGDGGYASSSPAGSSSSSPSSSMGHGYARVGYLGQFAILSARTWKNLYRNPMLMLTHYAIAISLAVLSGWLFYGLSDDIRGFQNRLGLFFFLLALFGFSSLTSLNVFATERLLFVRERANGYYSPATYFASKFLLDIVPLRIVPPLLMGSIIYPMTGLVADVAHFSRFMAVLVLFNLAAAAICFFIGIVCRDGGVANLVGSLVMLFSLLFAGLLLNHETIPAAATWLQTASIFHYGFEALIVNEVRQLTLVDKKYGLDITVPGAAILSSFGFDNKALGRDVANLGVFAAVFILLAYAAMHFLLVERR